MKMKQKEKSCRKIKSSIWIFDNTPCVSKKQNKGCKKKAMRSSFTCPLGKTRTSMKLSGAYHPLIPSISSAD